MLPNVVCALCAFVFVIRGEHEIERVHMRLCLNCYLKTRLDSLFYVEIWGQFRRFSFMCGEIPNILSICSFAVKTTN